MPLQQQQVLSLKLQWMGIVVAAWKRCDSCCYLWLSSLMISIFITTTTTINYYYYYYCFHPAAVIAKVSVEFKEECCQSDWWQQKSVSQTDDNSVVIIISSVLPKNCDRSSSTTILSRPVIDQLCRTPFDLLFWQQILMSCMLLGSLS